MYTPNYTQLSADFEAVNRDVGAVLNLPVPKECHPEDIKDVFEKAIFDYWPGTFNYLLYSRFSRLLEGANTDHVPTTEFGKVVLAACNLPNVFGGNGETCPESESRLIRCLNKQTFEEGTKKPVIITQSGVPVGYKKLNGFSDIAYFWDPVNAEIDGEPVSFIGDAFSVFDLDERLENKSFRAKGAVSVEISDLVLSEDFDGFARFSAFSLPKSLRELWNHWATINTPGLAHEFKETVSATPASIAQRVIELAANATPLVP